jgi:hypothetical protein
MAAKNVNKAEVNEGGRPPRYTSPDELQAKIEEYFSDGCNKRKVITKTGNEVEIPYLTVSGLAYYLGFESRQSFYDYEKHDKFSYIIKKARLRIEMMYEEMLAMGYPTGAIFALKNMGWHDKTDSDIKISGKLSIEPKEWTDADKTE